VRRRLPVRGSVTMKSQSSMVGKGRNQSCWLAELRLGGRGTEEVSPEAVIRLRALRAGSSLRDDTDAKFNA
jgi:hypothetical protein